MRNSFFFNNQAERLVQVAGRLVPGLLLFSEKDSFKIRASGMQLSFDIY